MALCMGRTSAQLISMKRIGDKKTHLKISLRILNTPPIAEEEVARLTDASTFHLKHWAWRAHRSLEEPNEAGICEEEEPTHNKHMGFLYISQGKYGKDTFQPVIHHPRQCKWDLRFHVKIKRSCWRCEHYVLSSGSQHDEKTTTHTFLRNRFGEGDRHCSNKSLSEKRKTHETFHKLSHHSHNWMVKGQWLRRWEHYSGLELLRMQATSKWAMIPKWASLHLVLILPNIAT